MSEFRPSPARGKKRFTFPAHRRRRFWRPVLPAVLITLIVFVLSLPCGPPALAAQDELQAGYRVLTDMVPGARMRLDVAIWYPCSRQPSRQNEEGWSFFAARNAPILPGPWPILLFSHDSPGSRFAHHTLATALARRGYIVVAPTHDGDNADDMSLLFARDQLPSRARQISAALDLLLGTPALSAQANLKQVAFVGFGSAASAGLLLAGASLTPDAWRDYCPAPASDKHNAASPPRRNAPPATNDAASLQASLLEDASASPPATSSSPSSGATASSSGASFSTPENPWCQPFPRARMDALTQALRMRSQAESDALAIHAAVLDSRRKTLEKAVAGVEKNMARLRRTQKKQMDGIPSPPLFLPLLPPLAARTPTFDPRIRALALLAPGFAMLFSRATLEPVSVPVLITGAPDDPLNPPELQAALLASLLSPPAIYEILPEADSLALMAPCPPDRGQNLPELCLSISPEQRASLHSQVAARLADFFKQAFGG